MEIVALEFVEKELEVKKFAPLYVDVLDHKGPINPVIKTQPVKLEIVNFSMLILLVWENVLQIK